MTDLFNLTLVKSQEGTDQVNKRFYGKYNYPWQPSVFPVYPPGVAASFLNQDIGYWQHDRIPGAARIWVAGCGTNQALFTALKFPGASVLGTDISTTSLEVCQKNADQLKVRNLKLEERSLNDVKYLNEFDYIICTGVVHHNAKPQATLNRISAALDKNGILELMMYNYYHRLQTTAFQKAIRTFYDSNTSFDMDFELHILKSLMAGFRCDSDIRDFLLSFNNIPEAAIADSLLQPVEYSYTIESLALLADDCNLEYLQYCPNQFDVNKNAVSWNLQFENEPMQELYYSLPDIKRWQISNLLMYKDSPMLWFYFQRKDSTYIRKTEQEISETFLETTFSKVSFPIQRYVLNTEGAYRLSDKVIQSDAGILKDETAKQVQDAVNNEYSMKDILYQLNIDTAFSRVNDIRLKLTTSVFPYILANQ
jgi:SAM-dependent methyltransferase